MKVLITGANGQLGKEITQVFNEQSNHTIFSFSRQDLDIASYDNVSTVIDQVKPDIIVHTAAYTAVDKAEIERELCWNVNVKGTENLVKLAKKINSKFIYISTDYVFNGDKTEPYSEFDETDPINYYGLTKYKGENMVRDYIDNHFIVRISWVFGLHGNNFVETMIRLSNTRSTLGVVADQFGSPTYTYDLSLKLLELINSEEYGTYHITNSGYCSWYDFAASTFELSGISVNLDAIKSKDFPTAARRPINSRLSKEKLKSKGFELLPSWQDALKRYIEKRKLN
jgi:dTDP-4-dehydrorhamnose reductase